MQLTLCFPQIVCRAVLRKQLTAFFRRNFQILLVTTGRSDFFVGVDLNVAYFSIFPIERKGETGSATWMIANYDIILANLNRRE
jgi:hypothetical protein